MALELPMGDMGSKNLPVPISPAPLMQADLGDRSLQPAKPADSLDPIIYSISCINDSLDSVATVVGDIEPLTVADLEKLFQKYFSKKESGDAIVEALSRQTSQVKESSFFVKNQVKASEIEQANLKRASQGQGAGNFEGVFGQKGGQGSPGGTGGSDDSDPSKKLTATGAYNTVLKGAYDLTHNPMSLIDKLAELPFKGIDKLLGKGKKDKSKGDLFGDFADLDDSTGGSPESPGNFFGDDFPEEVGSAVGEVVAENLQPFTESISDVIASSSMARGPLGTETDPLYVITMKPTKDMGELVDEAEQGFSKNPAGISGGGSKAGNAETLQDKAAKSGIKADNVVFDTFSEPEQSKFGGFLDKTMSGAGGAAGVANNAILAVVMGLILVGLLAFKDLITEVFERVLIPLGEVAVDFFRALKDPLIRLVNAFVDVAVVVLGIIKGVLLAIQPYIEDIAVIIVQTVKVVLEIVRDVLVAIKPYIVDIAVIIVQTVKVVLEIIRDVLTVLKPHIIKMADVVGGIIVKILELISEVLDVIKEPILEIVRVVTGVIVDALHLVSHILGMVFTAVEPLVAVIGKLLGGVIGTVAKGLDWVGDKVGKGLDWVGGKVGGAMDWLGGKISGAINWIGEKVTEPDPTTESLFKAMTKDLTMPDKEIPLLQGIFQHTYVISEILVSHFMEDAKGLSKRKVNDLVISSEGKEFFPTNDAVFAINSGVVSVVPSHPVSDYSGSNFSSSSYNSSSVQNNSQGAVNNYYSSNYDLSGIGPMSDFCPVGV